MTKNRDVCKNVCKCVFNILNVHKSSLQTLLQTLCPQKRLRATQDHEAYRHSLVSCAVAQMDIFKFNPASISPVIS